MTLPAGADLTALRTIDDVVERARVLARAAHAEQVDESGAPYYEGHLLDVHRRVAAYGGAAEDQAAALLHDVVEDTGVTEDDLVAAGFPDRTALTVHLLTKRPDEQLGTYDARLRAFEPARWLKLEGDIASNTDPDRLALIASPPVRDRLAAKCAVAARALSGRLDERAARELAQGR